ncbi:unnamed protein product [Chrysodeixis includens]|uniref:Uncharacterized protein n=1 Tax=Chrysodeixis includens TaxID=689277 RepID=A0A9P0BPD6_CHRIL|nr:unnamed protein product [Chrysodeixis includens]
MITIEKYIYIISSVFLIVVQLNAVTVNPALCPTNKIAPHRRQADWEQSGPRTFGLIHDLFVPPRRPQKPNPYNDLEEPPQEDDPEDCGEIEDYDETDLSSITPGAQKKKQDRNDRYFFGNDYVNSQHQYQVQNQYYSSSYRPVRPTRPPYEFEGNYGPNYYRPSSNHIKPVQENYLDRPQSAYRPGIIGGALGHIVGYPTVRPTTEDTIRRRHNYHVRFPKNDGHIRRPSRSQPSQQTQHAPNIFGSFIDLLFH